MCPLRPPLAEDRMRLARRRGVHRVEPGHEPGVGQHLQRVRLDELLADVPRHRLHVDAGHVEAGQLVAAGRSSGTAVHVEQARPGHGVPPAARTDSSNVINVRHRLQSHHMTPFDQTGVRTPHRQRTQATWIGWISPHPQRVTPSFGPAAVPYVAPHGATPMIDSLIRFLPPPAPRRQPRVTLSPTATVHPTSDASASPARHADHASPSPRPRGTATRRSPAPGRSRTPATAAAGSTPPAGPTDADPPRRGRRAPPPPARSRPSPAPRPAPRPPCGPAAPRSGPRSAAGRTGR